MMDINQIKSDVDRAKKKLATQKAWSPLGPKSRCYVLKSPDRTLSAIPIMAAALVKLTQYRGPLNHKIWGILAALSVTIDNETGAGKTNREMLGLSLKTIQKYVYDIYRYDKNKSLGNIYNDRSLGFEADAVKFRGAYLCGLTGRAGFQSVLPVAIKCYGIAIAKDSFYHKYKNIMKGDLKGLTDAMITSTSSQASFSLVVAMVFWLNYALPKVITWNDMSSSSWPSIEKEMIKFLNRQGYHAKETVWKKGGYTPGYPEMIRRWKYLIKLLKIQGQRTSALE